MPILQIPEQIREVDPNLKFKPLYRIENERFVIQIGYDVLSISSKMPYIGWSDFSKHSFSIINKVISSGIIKRVSRIGHRYINFFKGDITNGLTMSFSMTEKYTSENLLIRTDVKDGNFMNTLQFVNNANYKPHPNSIEVVGSLIDIDTSREYSDNYFTSNIEQNLFLKMNSLTTYINTNILLMSALSCMTLTDTELLSLSSRQTYNDAIIPSINTPVNPINIYTNYSIKDIPISTETIHVNIPEHEDFEIINSFANKMLTEATPIDEEIQNVINDHFWDML